MTGRIKTIQINAPTGNGLLWPVPAKQIADGAVVGGAFERGNKLLKSRGKKIVTQTPIMVHPWSSDIMFEEAAPA